MAENMFVVAHYNQMITISEPAVGAVCCVMKNGKLEDGDTYQFNGTEWIKIKFYDDEETS